MAAVKPLEASELYKSADLSNLVFETTDELVDINGPIGQPRAVEAIHFGVGIRKEGFNIYALGPTGLGKRALLERAFHEQAGSEETPPDWAYVYNFSDRRVPKAIRFLPGKGREFRDEMDHLVEELRTALTAAFESDEYRARKQALEVEFQERQEKALEALQEKARQKSFAMLRTPAGLVFAPVREGEVLSPEEYQNLPEDTRKQTEETLDELQKELQGLLQQAPDMQREARNRLKELNRGFINFAVGGLIGDLKKKYTEQEDITAYLQAVEEDVVNNASDFLTQEEDASGNPLAALMARAQAGQENTLQRYKVNLIVDNSQIKGAPVIYEDNPTYQNLIGQVEHIAQMGALVTDFTLIKPGSLHKANGGYLMIDALKLLQQPYSWEGLKRALHANCLRIESIGQMLSLISTSSLEPEPIPLNIKISLIGDRLLYYLLSENDPDFDELFKVQADFDEEMERGNGNQELYARMVASMVRENNLRPFDRGAVARIIEHASRMASDSARLTMHIHPLGDLLREADYWAGKAAAARVSAEHVDAAIAKQIYRADRVREKDQETILREIFLIDTRGEKVGQVNGLSVVQLGKFTFGKPSRITAQVWNGKAGVINIDREVNMSGPIHNKGVMILASFLNSRYTRKKPLALSASLVFEQSYGGVEGDSASSAELYVLLSAIGRLPVRQSLAVTGAINQHGQVQAIGGVNEKIEGFFDICQKRGLTGDQGVIIPSANVVHLMLRRDVVEAVSAGKFAIYPVDHIDQGIELLTGLPAGAPDIDGNYPDGSVNGRVQQRLGEMIADIKEEKDKEKPEEDKEEPSSGKEPPVEAS